MCGPRGAHSGGSVLEAPWPAFVAALRVEIASERCAGCGLRCLPTAAAWLCSDPQVVVRRQPEVVEEPSELSANVLFIAHTTAPGALVMTCIV